MSSAHAAVKYIKHGYAPIPIPARSKAPNLKDWQLLRLEPEDVPRYFNNGRNIGLLLGEPSGGLIDIDLDTPEAVAAGRYLLPGTLRSGRESSPNSHYWYRCEPVPSTAKFQVPRGGAGEGAEMFVELRSTGKQTVVAPSVHPDGGRYTWGEGEIATISGAALVERVREVATAALVARHWPSKGRHEITLAAAGYLGRRLAPERVESIIEAAAGAAGDEEWRDRSRAVQDTLEGLRIGRQVTGGPTLDQLAPGVPEILSRWWSWKRETIFTTGGTGESSSPTSFNNTDLGNAERMVKRHGANLRYCYAFGKWLHFDGGRWQIDDQGYAARLAKETVRSIFTEAAHAQDDDVAKRLGKWATTSQSEGHIKAMLELAKSEPGVPIKPEALDARENLLNVLNGTIELRTGELREHRREDLLTKMAPVKYDPDARAPVWKEFLDRVQPDADLREFLQRATGYSATADTSEQCMFINYGLGANGKSTYQETISAALGDYAMRTPTETLLVKRAGGVPNDVARLKGARFVSASETEEGRRLAESLVKDLTGQDTISARFMRADWFDFKPTHKLWLSTNHRPEIRGTDNAIWRRIRLVPWAITIPKAEQDRRLSKKLHDELPGVLAWIVRGCLEWRRGGLAEPEGVTTATSEYRAEMDVLGAFFTDCCVVAPDAKVYARDLYKAYVWWCEENGERPETQRRFGGRLKERGFESRRGGSRGAALYDGVGLTEHARERDGSTLTLQKVPISRASDLTDPENTINGLKNTSHGELCKKGSEGSEGSAKPSQPDDLADLRERLEGDE
jgi:putative DNA primase/helicase